MEDLLDAETWQSRWNQTYDWVLEHVFTLSTLVQFVAVIVVFIASAAIVKGLRPLIDGAIGTTFVAKLRRTVNSILLPLVWMAMTWLAVAGFAQAEHPDHILRIAASLLSAWIVIQLASKLVKNPTASRAIAWIAWVIAALNILTLLAPTIAILDSMAVTFSDELRISIYDIIKSTLALTVLLWLAFQAGGLLESRIQSSESLSPSLQVLLSKSLNIVLIALAIILAIRSVGIDLTALAVFSGAVGLGIGFGLQKIIGNLISGVILLLDKSIKPGDVIAVEDTYGWVNTLGGRYVSVITRDGTEHLIPNETLITEKVENWTHSSRKMRVKASIGIHYDADPHKAIELCEEAARATERVISDPPPVCLLSEFGDSSVNLELRFWIQDAQNGLANVTSVVLLRVWDALKENGIEIPYPQRDLHLRSADSAVLEQALAVRGS